MSERTAFVRTANNIEQGVLQSLIDQHVSEQAWRFLRWPDRVELLEPGESIDYSCREGQVFNQDCELRWKRQGEHYSVLLLSVTTSSESEETLKNVGDGWTAEDRDANFYPPAETRFPKGLTYSDALDIGQRYFIDSATATVQFTALRVK
ncbi:MAG: hypothetical protein AAGC93_31970 [Cyanobacteria bacterium P01_F01_bin.53]